jgi:hypothetical protein
MKTLCVKPFRRMSLSSSKICLEPNANFDVWFRIHKDGRLKQPLARSKIKAIFNREKFDMKRNPQFEERIYETWRKRLQANPKFFNGTKFRLQTVHVNADLNAEEDGNQVLELELGLSDYASYLGTNWNPDSEFVELLKNEGERLFGDSSAYFASPLGNAALVLTTDKCVPFIQRSKRTAEFASWWDVPGGHPEPSRVGINLDTPSIEISTDKIINELYESARDEIRTELNIPFSHIGEPLLIGIVRAHSSRGKPSAIL